MVFPPPTRLDISLHRKCGGNPPPNFPVWLYSMLEEIQEAVPNPPIAWAPHGRCFVVQDRNLFVSSYLPLWSKQTSFASFQRQLNIYGFHRIGYGPEKGGYYHDCFLRGKNQLVLSIRRQKFKGTGPRKPSPPPPDFSKMPPVDAAAAESPWVGPCQHPPSFTPNHGLLARKSTCAQMSSPPIEPSTEKTSSSPGSSIPPPLALQNMLSVQSLTVVMKEQGQGDGQARMQHVCDTEYMAIGGSCRQAGPRDPSLFSPMSIPGLQGMSTMDGMSNDDEPGWQVMKKLFDDEEDKSD